MAVHVALVKDALNGEGSRKPRVVGADTVEMESILDYMAGGVAADRTDFRAALSQFEGALLFYLKQGNKVATPFGTFSLSAHTSRREDGRPKIEPRNLRISFRPTRKMLKEVRADTPIVMEEIGGRQLPSVLSVRNMEEGGINAGRPGQILKLRGHRLSLDPGDEETGVFLIATCGETYRMPVYTRTGSSHIDFKLAEIPAGSYTVEVRTRPTHRDVWVGTGRAPFAVLD